MAAPSDSGPVVRALRVLNSSPLPGPSPSIRRIRLKCRLPKAVRPHAERQSERRRLEPVTDASMIHIVPQRILLRDRRCQRFLVARAA